MSPRRFRSTGGLLAVFCLGIVLAIGCGREEIQTEIASFDFAGVRASSDEMALEVERVSGTPHADFMEWACLLTCRETEGCRADLRVTVLYRSAGEDAQVVLTGTMDVPAGGRARLTRVQRPPVPVDGVQRVEVRVVADRGPSGGPPPTPRM